MTKTTTTPAALDIRHGHMPVAVVRLRGPDVAGVLQEIDQRYGDTPGFFEDEPALLDLSDWQGGDATALERQAVLQRLRQIGLAPLAFQGGSVAWQDDLRHHGCVAAEALTPTQTRAARETPAPSPSTSPSAAPPASPSALVVDRPLRSGQQVYARGRDLVVLAMVNPGAEVIADGHVHVYAPLRGKAIAGARGLTEARVFALSLEAELISIAGVYRTAEHPWPDNVRGRPTQVRLASGPDGDKLLFEPLV